MLAELNYSIINEIRNADSCSPDKIRSALLPCVFMVIRFHCSYNKTLECVVMFGCRTSIFIHMTIHSHAPNDFDNIYIYYFKLNN